MKDNTIDQDDNVIQIQTEFVLNCEPSLPPDPTLVAHSLFDYWIEYLNFHEHVRSTNDNQFATSTIAELSKMVSTSMTK